MADSTSGSDYPKLMTSEFVYNIVRFLHDAEEQKYSQQIVDYLQNIGHETSKASVSNYLKMLRDHGIIERGKRTKAQYYKLSYEGIYQTWIDYIFFLLNSIEEQTENVPERLKPILEENKEEYAPQGQDEVDVDEVMEAIEQSLKEAREGYEESKDFLKQELNENEEFEDFFLEYVKIYMDLVASHSTLDEMTRETLLEQLQNMAIFELEEQELPPELINLITVLSLTDMSKSSEAERAMKIALNNVYKLSPDEN